MYRRYLIAGAFGIFVLSFQKADAASAIDSCAAVIQFDTTTFSENYLAKLSILRMVNQSNYDESKRGFGINVPEYFSGSFEEFSKKRTELSESFSSNQSIASSTNFYQRVLSPAGAKAYAECVARVAPLPISAYISSGQRSEFIAVTVANNVVGSSKMTLSIITPDYIKRLNEPTVLLPGSQQVILFKSPLNQPFVAIINGNDSVTGGSFASASLELPPYVEYRLTNSYKEYRAVGACGAGGNGSTTGSPLKEVPYLSAESDYRLMPETVTVVERRLIFGPGIVRDPDWNWIRTPADSDRPNTMRGEFGNCEGASGHTQSRIDYVFSIRAVKQTVTKVPVS